MAVDLEKLLALRIEKLHPYSAKDVMLYALGLGLGREPSNPRQLSFVYEKDLKVLPTFGSVLGYAGFFPKERPELGINWKKLLNGEMGIEMHAPIPTSGAVTGTTVIDRLIDKGAEKGSLLYIRRDVNDEAGNLLCTVTNTTVLRGDGGFGGPLGRAEPPPSVPQREPDLTFEWPTLPQAALIYRLSGDYNPLHAEPDVAQSAGFAKPILHGAATWGMAGYALMESLCGGQPEGFKRMNARFTSPAFPGEMQRTLIWKTGRGTAAFRVVAPERGATVLDNGEFGYLD